MNGSREIALTQGYIATVDEADYETLVPYHWFIRIRRRVDGSIGIVYARRSIHRDDGRRTTLGMHQMLLPGSEQVDHIDGNGLNNTRANLRTATHAQNARNRRVNVNSSSGYKGVFWHTSHQRWCAQIRLNYRYRFLGYFDNPIDAARAYDAAARELFGEFARPNLPIIEGSVR